MTKEFLDWQVYSIGYTNNNFLFLMSTCLMHDAATSRHQKCFIYNLIINFALFLFRWILTLILIYHVTYRQCYFGNDVHVG